MRASQKIPPVHLLSTCPPAFSSLTSHFTLWFSMLNFSPWILLANQRPPPQIASRPGPGKSKGRPKVDSQHIPELPHARRVLQAFFCSFLRPLPTLPDRASRLSIASNGSASVVPINISAPLNMRCSPVRKGSCHDV